MQNIDLSTCKKCGAGPFKNYAGLSKHISQKHPDITNQDYYDTYLKKEGEGVCARCGGPTKFSGRLNRGYYIHCSQKCTANDSATVSKRKETNLTVHGSAGYNNHEKTSATKLERYGDANYANGEQIKATKMERYGIAGYNNPKKRKETKRIKYGASNYVNSEKCADTKERRYGSRTYNNQPKMQETKTLRYGNPYYLNHEQGRQTAISNTVERYREAIGTQCDILGYDEREFRCRCNRCGSEFTIPINTGYMRLFRYGIRWCTVCNPAETSRSKEEDALYEYVASLVGKENAIRTDRNTVPYCELDIYIPSKKIAIEFDGLYWHSEVKKPGLYHLRKTVVCESLGIRLIHVFEDEWNFRMDTVKSRLKAILGCSGRRIYARKCEVTEIPRAEADDFIEKNHIQGACVSAWRYALKYDGETCAVMTFGKNRFGEGYELLRYCTRGDTEVAGGASRLLRHFTREHPEVTEIMSFADRRWSGPDAFYPKLGFTPEGTTRPAYYYVVNNARRNRMEFAKHRLVAAGFDPGMSEHEIMLSRGIYRIYDCGNYRFRWVRPG